MHHLSWTWLPQGSKFSGNHQNDDDIITCQYDFIVGFLDVPRFVLSNWDGDPSFMAISVLVLKLQQISFARD